MRELTEKLRAEAKAFGPALAKRALELGLAVTSKQGHVTPIPITATPIILSKQELAHRTRLSARLSSAVFKVAKAVLAGSAQGIITEALSPLERTLAEKTAANLQRLVTTRVDFFVEEGKALALELNATIPAMQGYSDIAARSFLEIVGRSAGLSEARKIGRAHV